MTHTNNRISAHTAEELLALASQIENQKHQEYIPKELVQAATEAGISVDTLQEALHQLQTKQTQFQTRNRQLLSMLSSGLAGAAIALVGCGVYSMLNRQPTIEPPISAITTLPTPSTLTPDGYAATYTGIVQQYLLNPEGTVEGLLLKNGLQVKVPPHLNQALMNLVNPGGEVNITGIPGTPTRFGQEIRAVQVMNHRTQQVLAVQPRSDPPSPPNATDYSNLSTEGSVI